MFSWCKDILSLKCLWFCDFAGWNKPISQVYFISGRCGNDLQVEALCIYILFTTILSVCLHKKVKSVYLQKFN